MRALVTGGAGFIASHVCDRLLADGWTVGAIDNFDPYYDPSQKRRNVAAASRSDAYRLHEADVCDEGALDQAFASSRPDVVIHLAARAGVRASVEDPAAYVRVNELGGLNVLEAARRHGLLPVVFASTSSVYGATDRLPFREDDPADRPLSPYAASKRGAELMAHAYHHLHRLPIALLRFFTVYGPRGRPDMALSLFTRQMLAGEALRLNGEETARDFTYIDDIVAGVVGAARWIGSPVEDGARFGTFNLGRSEPVRVRRLIELLGRSLGVKPEIELGSLAPGESARTSADIQRAHDAFGYEPRVALEAGVAKWVEWLGSTEAPAWARAFR